MLCVWLTEQCKRRSGWWSYFLPAEFCFMTLNDRQNEGSRESVNILCHELLGELLAQQCTEHKCALAGTLKRGVNYKSGANFTWCGRERSWALFFLVCGHLPSPPPVYIYDIEKEMRETINCYFFLLHAKYIYECQTRKQTQMPT